jgi:hypothetical protein
MTTFIPLFILAMLGNPEPSAVRTDIDAPHNVICWSANQRAVCYGYSDEGTHLAVRLNREE